MRLARFLATAGIGSRRSCERLIRDGRVNVNASVIDQPATNVDPEIDAVTCDGKPVRPRRSVYLALNKPRGFTCSNADEHADRLVSELFPARYGRLFTVGRLDRDSEGLILVTNDGEFAQRINHPKFGVLKRYRAKVAGKPPPDVLERMIQGFEHGGEFLKAERVRWAPRENGKTLLLTLREGKKREVRRMCTACGLTVRRLTRESVGPVHLRRLKAGKWRHLTDEELDALTPHEHSAKDQ